MNTFIPTIRDKRREEINNHKANGIGFIEENHYKLLERIYIKKEEEMFCFEVRVNFSDVRFYISKNNSCIYLSINEIYMLLNDINLNGDIDITKGLYEFYDSTEKEIFTYNNIEYKFPKSPSFEEKYQVRIPYSTYNITYTELMLLIFLIQEKSNYFWSISKKDVIYKNGIISLLITLLSYHNENELLKEIGWYYLESEHKYSENKLSSLDKDDEKYEEREKIVKRKYYLTEDEMKSILKS